jgi:hypothetical protein
LLKHPHFTGYGVVTGILSQIRDGHMRGYLTPDYRRFLHASAKRLPVRVRLLSNALYVLTSADEQIPPGSELLAIQGMPVPQVVEIMVNHLSGDGDILTNKDAAIGGDFWLVPPVHRAARYFEGGVPTGCAEEERGALRDNSGSSKKARGSSRRETEATALEGLSLPRAA